MAGRRQRQPGGVEICSPRCAGRALRRQPYIGNRNWTPRHPVDEPTVRYLCRHCRSPIYRRNQLYCSNACRQAGHRQRERSAAGWNGAPGATCISWAHRASSPPGQPVTLRSAHVPNAIAANTRTGSAVATRQRRPSVLQRCQATFSTNTPSAAAHAGKLVNSSGGAPAFTRRRISYTANPVTPLGQRSRRALGWSGFDTGPELGRDQQFGEHHALRA